jgi:hypothetical protein
VNHYTNDKGFLTTYTGCTIYAPTGATVATPPLPELKSIQTVSSDSVYDSHTNAIYSLTSGQPLWSGTYTSTAWNNNTASTGLGAASGSYVVYQTEHRVVAESH